MPERRFARNGSLSARVLARIVDYVAARGHDPSALCRSAGLELAVLRQPDARIPYALAERLGERALLLSQDPNLGLHLAQDVGQAQHFDAGLLLLAASPTVRDALERMIRYQRYWGDGERSKLVPDVQGVSVRYVLPGAGEVTQRHNDECAMAEIRLGLDHLAARSLTPRAVRFRHRAPRDRREQDALFGCPIEYSQPHTEITYDDAALETPLRHADEFYAEIFRHQVERAIAALPPERDLGQEVRSVLLAELPRGTCTLASTARALGLSVRTLQRRLEAAGTSFDVLVETFRHEQALCYLDRQLTVRDIATLLGYGETSAFHRAFRRWTGTTPERARSIRLARH